jgi:hypothetical protein
MSRRNENLADFTDRHAGIVLVLGAVLRGEVVINDFAMSLAQQLLQYGTLTERQVAAFKNMAEREKADKAERPAVDLDPVEQMFFRATASGYQKPVYRAEGLVISRAAAGGRNAAALYVKDDCGEYLGKVQNGRLFLTREARSREAEVTTSITVIAENPLEAAIRHGRRTGRCACCGRELTKHASIDAGIGPICAEKWGF